MPRRVTPEEAKDLIDKEGWVYVDVRSIGEFNAGHATGAYNIPLNHIGRGGGVAPNEKFLAAVDKVFPKDAKLIVACQAGGRSARAAAQLETAGFTNVADLTAGFEGKVDAATRQISEPGWRRKNLPVTQDSEPGKTWEGIEARLGEAK
jgi:rhodanese-related sulfurtransferase